jgi:hypothetical protein
MHGAEPSTADVAGNPNPLVTTRSRDRAHDMTGWREPAAVPTNRR